MEKGNLAVRLSKEVRMSKDTWIFVMIVSTLIMVCLILGLTLAYSQPMVITPA